MQVLIDGEVWFGNPGYDALTYDPTLLPTLPRSWPEGLIDPSERRDCLAVWPTLKGRWFRAMVDVEVTIVRATITLWDPHPEQVPSRPGWWLGPDAIQKYLDTTL